MTTIVVGGGASGAALAARLSEDPSRTVVLLEAGPADGAFPAALLDASTIRGAMPGHPANWSYPALLTPDRPYTIARGRILGGSTTINGGYFIRARSADLDAWARVGGERWSYERTLPVWRALEADADYPGSALHGGAGPMPVARPPQGALARTFADAARARGHADEPDKNGDQPSGVGPVPSNVRDGIRVNAGLAYLEPIRSRPNLRIEGGTRVLRVVVEGDRAVGVETSRGVVRGEEVVLCTGAIGSAGILLASGIGPRAGLEAAGMRVVADLPVGTEFSDHPQVSLGWHAAQAVVDPAERFAFPTAVHVDSSGPAGRYPDGDLELLLSVKPLGYLLTGAEGADDMPLLVGLQTPVGRGSITLANADPAAPLRIEYRYLEEEADRSRLRDGVREAVALLRSDAMADAFGGFIELGDPDLDDDALDAWIRAHLGTAIHMCGTAPMGSVVDGAGRVHGVEGLRVADTSILPHVPSRGPAASAVLVGEVIARAMRE